MQNTTGVAWTTQSVSSGRGGLSTGVNQCMPNPNSSATPLCPKGITSLLRHLPWLRSERTRCIYQHTQQCLVPEEAHAHQHKLSEAKENILKEWIKRGIPLSLETIANYASELAREDIGKERNPDLKVKCTTDLEECHAQALNCPVVQDYVELLRNTIKRYDVKPKNIFNMDEKVIPLASFLLI
ncbi:hypothetical protein DFH07DRAFT_783653 [Mycena maculata]|uniref:Uncharacterized protein n=1 Tax=Mycena maculata TaxID=230809 RepID=A0AAD7MLV0_9AGAR|nr:hypothetical protein DFH07DRAFT_783653 [Mycena maculata]